MKDLVEYLARSLVDDPNTIEVKAESATEQPNQITCHLHVGKGDLGKVIGKKGRTAKALRTLLTAAGQKQGLRVVLDIVDPAQDGNKSA